KALSSEDWSTIQLNNAATIASVAAQRGYDARATAVAINVAMVETNLRNLANDGSFRYRPGVMSRSAWNKAREVAQTSMDQPHDGTGSDWDSVGLFQQRPSAGWGEVADLMDPATATTKFFDAMEDVDGWHTITGPELAQRVQRSAFPDRYVDKWPAAQDLAANLAGYARQACDQAPAGTTSADRWPLPAPAADYGLTGRLGTARLNYTRMGDDFAAPLDTPILAIAEGTVIHVSCQPWKGRSPCQIQLDHGADEQGQRITSLYVHMYPSGVGVGVGAVGHAGGQIGQVGSNGNSTGPHVHVELWVDGQPESSVEYLRSAGVDL